MSYKTDEGDAQQGVVQFMEVLSSAVRNAQRLALIVDGSSYTYRQLLGGAVAVARRLKGLLPKRREGQWGPRVGLYAKPSAAYVAATWGTWLAGGIIVPLCCSHTRPELEYVIQDAAIPIVLTDAEMVLDMPSVQQVPVDPFPQDGVSEGIGETRLTDLEEGALIIYTSGTTGRPKGALHTHRNLSAQMESLSKAWEWSANDVLLHALPLHHIHGIVNALYTAHYNGACVRLLPKFSPSRIWSTIDEGEVSLFMGVPTMYSHLLSSFNEKSSEERTRASKAAERLRLYVSGSAACPESVMRQWKEVSNHWLLERYGMTEIGMALSNPLNGERRPGFVGKPLPGVTVKIVPETELIGELYVKGEILFREYWCNLEATAEAFDSEGYFKTGDIVTMEGTPPYFKILGRRSVDIIKSGGYKLSALEIENVILEHPRVKECSVIGLPDDIYGEIVAAIISPNDPIHDLPTFCTARLAKYKIPKRFIPVQSIPRNAMGKVNKKELINDIIHQQQ